MAAVVLGDQSEVEKHLAEGKKLLQEGQLSDALHHYTAAVGENHRYSMRYNNCGESSIIDAIPACTYTVESVCTYMYMYMYACVSMFQECRIYL